MCTYSAPPLRAGMQRLQPVRGQRKHNASDTRAKRGHNAKSNASLTRTNAGFCGSTVESGAAYVLVFKDLRPDRERNQKNKAPVLVNKCGAANPGGSRLLGGFWTSRFWDCIGSHPCQGTTSVVPCPGRKAGLQPQLAAPQVGTAGRLCVAATLGSLLTLGLLRWTWAHSCRSIPSIP
jgi:hypothetical protein